MPSIRNTRWILQQALTAILLTCQTRLRLLFRKTSCCIRRVIPNWKTHVGVPLTCNTHGFLTIGIRFPLRVDGADTSTDLSLCSRLTDLTAWCCARLSIAEIVRISTLVFRLPDAFSIARLCCRYNRECGLANSPVFIAIHTIIWWCRPARHTIWNHSMPRCISPLPTGD